MEKDEVADDDGCLPEAGAMVCVSVCGSRTLGAERKKRDDADEGGAEGDVGEGSRDLGSLCVCVGEWRRGRREKGEKGAQRKRKIERE
ncbi:hypothetical protein EV1_002267 [Malus domestica]